MGTFVVPTLNLFQKLTIPGKKYPPKTPINIARKIHRVRYLSRKDNLFIILVL
jgi:hypothetical protein